MIISVAICAGFGGVLNKNDIKLEYPKYHIKYVQTKRVALSGNLHPLKWSFRLKEENKSALIKMYTI